MSTFQPRLRRPASQEDDDSDASSTDFDFGNAGNSRHITPLGLYPGQPRSLSGIALRAFCLGVAFAFSLLLTILALTVWPSPLWRASFFLLALSTFHFLEFWVTARRNTLVATTDSFLLTANWPAYAIAHASAFAECILVSLLFPDRSWSPSLPSFLTSLHPYLEALSNVNTGNVLVGAGLVLVIVGQAVRSAAMLHAGMSFNHQIQWSKSDSHVLVTSGVYGLVRHPSYFGFFYWGLGTQLVLGNVVCFVVYAGVLWYFFSRRIRIEEKKLVEFFKEDYVQYRTRVGTWMPFI